MVMVVEALLDNEVESSTCSNVGMALKVC